mgnify:CR=1 FL=1
MIQSKNLFRSTLLLFGCFLALNLHIAYGQETSSGDDLKAVCPTESTVKQVKQ